MTFRLIAADLDGTLIGDDLIISHEVTDAFHAAREAGLLVTIATGRTFAGALPFAHQLDVNAPLILCQGAEIRDVETGEAIYRTCLPLESAREIIDVARSAGVHLNVFVDDIPYTDALTPAAELYQKIDRAAVQPVGDLKEWLDKEPTKIMLVADAEKLSELEPRLRERFHGRLKVVRSHHHFLEVIPLGASKGRALARLARHLGIHREEVCAIGDNDNDADMLRWAGLGVAVENASPAARKAADTIAPSVEKAGAAWAVRHLVLEKMEADAREAAGLSLWGVIPADETPLCRADDPQCLERALQVLRGGGIAAFPTDTVYGVGADARDPDAVAELYIAKRRPPSKAIPILISEVGQLRQFVRYIPEKARPLMEAFWPGGLTLVLPKADDVPAIISDNPGIAVRMPDHPVPLELIRRLGAPLATTSANISGDEAPVTAQEVLAQLGRRVDVIVDGGMTAGGIASAVVDLTLDPPRLLRAGAIPIEALRKILPDLVE